MGEPLEIKFPTLPVGDVIFSFVGGHSDGRNIALTRPPTVDSLFAHWVNSKGGKVGFKFPVTSPAISERNRDATAEVSQDGKIKLSNYVPGQNHVYEITKREEREGDIILRCEYRGTPEDFSYSAMPE